MQYSHTASVSSAECDEKTRSKLEIIGAYIIDVYYNILYEKAIQIKESTGNSITESYRYTISEYIKHVDTTDFYKAFLHGLRYYTVISVKSGPITHVQCLNLFVEEFIPVHYINSLTEVQKNNIMFMVVKNTLIRFTDCVLKGRLSMIIDEHYDLTNVNMLQEDTLEILLKERDISYNTFVQTESITSTDIKVKYQNNKGLLIESLKNERKLAMNIDNKNKTLNEMTKKYKQCVNKYAVLSRKLEKAKSDNNELKKIIIQQVDAYKTITAALQATQTSLSQSPTGSSQLDYVNNSSVLYNNQSGEAYTSRHSQAVSAAREDSLTRLCIVKATQESVPDIDSPDTSNSNTIKTSLSNIDFLSSVDLSSGIPPTSYLNDSDGDSE